MRSTNVQFVRSPGYALSLLAESTTSAIHCSEAVSKPGGTPEDVALLASRALLSEIRLGSCVDRKHQSLVLLMMVLGSEDVGRCRMSEPAVRTYVLHPSPDKLLTQLIKDTIPARYQELLWNIIQNRACRSVRPFRYRADLFLLWDWLR